MNQFKRAKQKALDSGHQVENITDLQTAGVKTPAKEDEKNKKEIHQSAQAAGTLLSAAQFTPGNRRCFRLLFFF